VINALPITGRKEAMIITPGIKKMLYPDYITPVSGLQWFKADSSQQ
jgi:hypothetical protein